MWNEGCQASWLESITVNGGYCRQTDGPLSFSHRVSVSCVETHVGRRAVGGRSPSRGCCTRCRDLCWRNTVSGIECVDAHVKNGSFSKLIEGNLGTVCGYLEWTLLLPQSYVNIPPSLSWCSPKRPISLRHLMENTSLF